MHEQLFNQWRNMTEDAIKSVIKYTEPVESAPGFSEFVNWALATQSSGYGWLPVEWGGSLGSAAGAEMLFSHIWHALYDDGDISFVVVNDAPRIVFVNRFDSDFSDKVLTQSDRMLAERRAKIGGETTPLVVLDCSIAEFCAIHDAYEEKCVRRAFAFEAARWGVEFAVKNASRWSFWNPDWINTESEQIEKNKAALLASNN